MGLTFLLRRVSKSRSRGTILFEGHRYTLEFSSEERRYRGVAAEILPVFESREVHDEAMASLLLFQQACAEERATLERIQQIASALRRDRRGNGGS
jgi:hypothetical protein